MKDGRSRMLGVRLHALADRWSIGPLIGLVSRKTSAERAREVVVEMELAEAEEDPPERDPGEEG